MLQSQGVLWHDYLLMSWRLSDLVGLADQGKRKGRNVIGIELSPSMVAIR